MPRIILFSIRPSSLDTPALTWKDLAVKIKDAQEYADTMKKGILATGLTGLNTNLNNAIKNGIDPKIGGLSVAEGILSAYKTAIAIEPEKNMTVGKIFSKIISKKEREFLNEKEIIEGNHAKNIKGLEKEVDEFRKKGPSIEFNKRLQKLEIKHKLLRKLDAERQALQRLYYMLGTYDPDMDISKINNELISNTDKAIDGFSNAVEIVDTAINRAKAVLPTDIHKPILRIDSAQKQAMAANPEITKNTSGSKLADKKPSGVKNFLPVDTIYGFLYDNNLPNDEIILNRIISDKSGSSRLFIPQRDIAKIFPELRAGSPVPPMMRAEHRAAMNEWVAAVKNKQIISVPKAGILRGIGSTVLQIAGYAPLPSEVIDAFTGATSQAWIDMYNADIKNAENAINASNDAIVALEAERDSIAPVSSKPKSASMKGDDSRDRQKRINALQARIDVVYKKRDAWMDALGWLHGKLTEKIEKRENEEYGEMLEPKKYVPINRPVY